PRPFSRGIFGQFTKRRKRENDGALSRGVRSASLDLFEVGIDDVVLAAAGALRSAGARRAVPGVGAAARALRRLRVHRFGELVRRLAELVRRVPELLRRRVGLLDEALRIGDRRFDPGLLRSIDRAAVLSERLLGLVDERIELVSRLDR